MKLMDIIQNSLLNIYQKLILNQCSLLLQQLVLVPLHMVKNIMKAGNAEGRMKQDFFGRSEAPFKPLSNKPTVPSDEEQARNPRRRSAKLRIAERQ